MCVQYINSCSAEATLRVGYQCPQCEDEDPAEAESIAWSVISGQDNDVDQRMPANMSGKTLKSTVYGQVCVHIYLHINNHYS